MPLPSPVIPAKAGIQGKRQSVGPWTPAFAGVTDIFFIRH